MSPTNADAIPITVSFSEQVSELTLGGIGITNGSIGSITADPDRQTFAFAVTPAINGPITILIQAGAVTDDAGNPNTASALFSITSDRTAPTVNVNTTGSGSITGSAFDTPAGVTEVTVSVSNGTNFWDGVGFNSAAELFLPATTANGWTTWSLALSAPAGTYTVRAHAVDAAGNETTTAEVSVGLS